MKLTLKRLRAMEGALNAALAGPEGEGDMADTSFADLEAALAWVHKQIEKRIEQEN
ncbi:hypothetical protein LZK98_11675 [Sphingomonas cannabina]|uniref:hypothetical protein n=1 Tax=Sphingomonas cannabina TaxID=2899123 RepID=UPI001F173AEF|nr:hypothetical protein [Sphingomonas cannabina]UIJ43750.1 hypothetical protein LZK98_11675 [Sphingomonas cannabina]